jgi:hypothetical protein
MEISKKDVEIINDILGIHNRIPGIKFDPTKIQYNSYYHTPDFWFKKFPKGFEEIPVMHDIIDEIIQKNHDNSPLAEIESLHSLSDELRYDLPQKLSTVSLDTSK